jgi:hypothetical protein
VFLLGSNIQTVCPTQCAETTVGEVFYKVICAEELESPVLVVCEGGFVNAKTIATDLRSQVSQQSCAVSIQIGTCVSLEDSHVDTLNAVVSEFDFHFFRLPSGSLATPLYGLSGLPLMMRPVVVSRLKCVPLCSNWVRSRTAPTLELFFGGFVAMILSRRDVPVGLDVDAIG